jgi:hypothetical protein
MQAPPVPKLWQQLLIWSLGAVSALWLAAIAAGLLEVQANRAQFALAPHLMGQFIAMFTLQWSTGGGSPWRYSGVCGQILGIAALAAIHVGWLAESWMAPAAAVLVAAIAAQILGAILDHRRGAAVHPEGLEAALDSARSSTPER